MSIEVNGSSNENFVTGSGELNFKQKFAHFMKEITGDKHGYWGNKIKDWGSVLDGRVVFAKKENRNDKVDKEIGKLTGKYGKSEAERILSAKGKLGSKNFITRSQGFRELRKIEKNLIKNSKNGALANTDAVKNDKLPTFSGEQVGDFSSQLFFILGVEVHSFGTQKYKQDQYVNWEVKSKSDDEPHYSLVASKGEEDKKEVHLEDIQFKNTNRGIVAQFKDPYNEENIIAIPVQVKVFDQNFLPGAESYIKSGGGTYSLTKSEDGTYSLSELGEPKGVDIQDTEVTQSGQPSSSDAEVTNIDGNVDLNEAKDKEQILQECQQLIDESVEAFKNEYGGSEEPAGWFGGKLEVLLRNMEGTNKFSVENFKKAVECEKAIYNEVLAAQEEFAKQDNLAENNTQYDSSKFATGLSVRLEIKLLNMINSTNDLSVGNFKKVIGEEKKNFVEMFNSGYEVQIDVPIKADAKAKASRMKKLGRSIARGAAKFGTGCMNVLSAIGNAFSNIGKKISNAKSNSDGYIENQLDNESKTSALISTDPDNDDPIWNGKENQGEIGGTEDNFNPDVDPFAKDFEEAI